MCDVNRKCFYTCMSVYVLTPGTQNNSVVKSCLFAFSSPIFPFHLYLYTCLSMQPSSCACLSLSLSSYLSLYVSLTPPPCLCHSVWFPCLSTSFSFFLQFQPIYIPVSPFSSLSFPLKSVTYLQHSCLMNNGGETVTISISIRRIRFDLCCASLPYSLSSQLSYQVSPHLMLSNFSPLFSFWEFLHNLIWDQCDQHNFRLWGMLQNCNDVTKVQSHAIIMPEDALFSNKKTKDLRLCLNERRGFLLEWLCSREP